MSAAAIGDRCSNGAYVERWTCPNCYHDHDAEVSRCAGCGAGLICSIENEPHAYCVLDSLPVQS